VLIGPDDLVTRMISSFTELQRLPEIKVPRCLQLKEEVKFTSVQVFVDASKITYGAVVYLSFEYKNDRVSTSFVTSKTKVAPLQSISIPPLELLETVLKE